MLRPNKLLLLVPLGLIALVHAAEKHPSGIRGVVTYSVGHSPVRNAYVLAHRNGAEDLHTRTDATGGFALPLDPGIYDVLVSSEFFAPASRKIEVEPDGMMVYNVSLKDTDVGMQRD